MSRPSFLTLSVVLALVLSVGSMAANRVVVQSRTVLANPCIESAVEISIENDVPLYAFSLPLVVRAGSPSSFWTSVGKSPETGRLATALSGVRLLETGLADFQSPDQVVLYFEAADAGDCLPPGPLEVMTGLSFHNSGAEGLFEIDSMSYPPCYSPGFVQCGDLQPIGLTEFVKGTIEVFSLPGGCNGVLTFDSSSLTAWAGASLSNQIYVIDPDGETGLRLRSGPGEIDSLTALWTWESSPADSGVHQVIVETYESWCPDTPCRVFFFNVTLKGLVPGDLNCDGIVNVVDIVVEVGHAFRAEPPPQPCWDL